MKSMRDAIKWYGEDGLIPVHEEQGVYNFYLQVPSETRSSSSEKEGGSDFTGPAKKR